MYLPAGSLRATVIVRAEEMQAEGPKAPMKRLSSDFSRSGRHDCGDADRLRPVVCGLSDEHCGELERWTLSGVELLAEAPRVFLHVPCPRCGERFAYRRDNAGERVRVLALRVSEHGRRCQGCQAFWPPEQFEWLARLLGRSAPGLGSLYAAPYAVSTQQN